MGRGREEGEGKKGMEEGEGKEGRGKGKEGDGKGGREGERGKEKDDLHPTLFLGPALSLSPISPFRSLSGKLKLQFL